MSDDTELKLYFDFKSPYAYLAAQPALDLPDRYDVEVRWIPFVVRIKGKGQRSIYSEWKARYSYMDARRWANRRGGFTIRGPRKVYDPEPALIGALFAQREGFFPEYTLQAFARFFEHRLEIDEVDAVAGLVEELGHSADAYRAYLAGEGKALFEKGMEEAHEDHVFGVPIFNFRGELFWGHDRIPLLEERLADAGLAR